MMPNLYKFLFDHGTGLLIGFIIYHWLILEAGIEFDPVDALKEHIEALSALLGVAGIRYLHENSRQK